MEVVQAGAPSNVANTWQQQVEKPRATTLNIEGAAFGKSGAFVKLFLAGGGGQQLTRWSAVTYKLATPLL